MTPSTLLHPLKLDVVGFQEDEHDYHFRVELPEPKCCQSCGTLYNLVKFAQEHKVVKPKPRRQSPFEGMRRMTYYSMANDFDFDEPTDYGVPPMRVEPDALAGGTKCRDADRLPQLVNLLPQLVNLLPQLVNLLPQLVNLRRTTPFSAGRFASRRCTHGAASDHRLSEGTESKKPPGGG